MRIRDDFNKLVSHFRRESEKKTNINLIDLFKEALIFFEKLKEMLKHCSENEKKEVFQVMAEMHAFLLEESKKLAAKSGLTEDQLLKFSENPDNFTPAQWKALEVVKQKLGQTAKELSQVIQKTNAPQEGKQPETQQEQKKKTKSSKKDRWLRS